MSKKSYDSHNNECLMNVSRRNLSMDLAPKLAL